jgi:hypothetical protein
MQRDWQALEPRRSRIMLCSIISKEGISGKLLISKKLLKGHVFSNRKPVIISAGSRRETVEVVSRTDISENEIIMSHDIFKALLIPGNLSYQIRFEENTIKLGPVIGLLMASDKERLTRGRLKKLLDYSTRYSEINGLIIALSADEIDFDKKLVKGYYYNPDNKGKQLPWEEGVFPLPDAVYQRVDISEDIRLNLKKATNNSLFNSKYFNKWEFWRMISMAGLQEGYLPETRLLTSLKDIDHLLLHHEEAYIKPINGTLSRGIYKVKNIGDIYEFQDKEGNAVSVNSKEEAQKHISKITGGHRYLVQQAIKPIKVEGRHLDFRVIMQKDHTMEWSCTGIVAFIGRRGDICTNWGTVSTFENILSRYFKFNQQQISGKRQEVIARCRRICETLDQRGENFGDLGFDVIIDSNLKPWILEANKRHYHTVPLWINDYKTFYEVKANPIRYAAALGGFQVYK